MEREGRAGIGWHKLSSQELSPSRGCVGGESPVGLRAPLPATPLLSQLEPHKRKAGPIPSHRPRADCPRLGLGLSRAVRWVQGQLCPAGCPVPLESRARAAGEQLRT